MQDLSEARTAAQDSLERALFEIKRVIAGQDTMLERVLVCLLADGHLLIEGVPGLAKTLTIKTTAQVLGGTFNRIQFTPDLMPSDLIGTRIYRPHDAEFDVELGPVFCNSLLADEINRAPAKVQSALLEVMQERQVTIGKESFAAPAPFLVLATQNPIESEGTYPLPEAQVDRFMLKVVVGYPAPEDELTVVDRSLAGLAEVRQILDLDELSLLRARARAVYVDPALSRYAVQVASATRDPKSVGLSELASYVSFGASPRRPIGPAPARCRRRSCARSTSRSGAASTASSPANTAPRPSASAPSSRRSVSGSRGTTCDESTGTRRRDRTPSRCASTSPSAR